MAITGMLVDVQWARTAGLVLIAPIFLGGLLLAVVVFPILIIANRKHERSDEDDYDEENEHASIS